MPARKFTAPASNFVGLTTRSQSESPQFSYLWTRFAVVVWLIVGLPPIPVTVKVYVPFATERSEVTVRVDDEPDAGFGEKVPLAPAGKPLIDIDTGELKPFVRAIDTV
jgi:hypothetical protein